jgi:hypothetical protein
MVHDIIPYSSSKNFVTHRTLLLAAMNGSTKSFYVGNITGVGDSRKLIFVSQSATETMKFSHTMYVTVKFV